MIFSHLAIAAHEPFGSLAATTKSLRPEIRDADCVANRASLTRNLSFLSSSRYTFSIHRINEKSAGVSCQVDEKRASLPCGNQTCRLFSVDGLATTRQSG
jgi:hypothetical protein